MDSIDRKTINAAEAKVADGIYTTGEKLTLTVQEREIARIASRDGLCWQEAELVYRRRHRKEVSSPVTVVVLDSSPSFFPMRL